MAKLSVLCSAGPMNLAVRRAPTNVLFEGLRNKQNNTKLLYLKAFNFLISISVREFTIYSVCSFMYSVLVNALEISVKCVLKCHVIRQTSLS